MNTTRSLRYGLLIVLALLAACAQTPVRQTARAPASPPPVLTPQPPQPVAPAPAPAQALAKAKPSEESLPLHAPVSQALTAKEYRSDAARHLYNTYQQRIYRGKLPPMLKAVGVIEIAVNSQGGVDEIVWLRAPRHVPEVMREIEQQVRAAAPYPAPVRMKHVKYTDTWLWHASGQFQLDTLTEGQY